MDLAVFWTQRRGTKEKEGNGAFRCVSVLKNSEPSRLEAAQLQREARKPFLGAAGGGGAVYEHAGVHQEW